MLSGVLNTRPVSHVNTRFVMDPIMRRLVRYCLNPLEMPNLHVRFGETNDQVAASAEADNLMLNMTWHEALASRPRDFHSFAADVKVSTF